eukprot:12803887-Prorocentrum_lima.AAC.1
MPKTEPATLHPTASSENPPRPCDCCARSKSCSLVPLELSDREVSPIVSSPTQAPTPRQSRSSG